MHLLIYCRGNEKKFLFFISPPHIQSLHQKITFFLSVIKEPKAEIQKLVTNLKTIKKTYRLKFPYHIYSKIIHTDTNNKLLELNNFIRS